MADMKGMKGKPRKGGFEISAPGYTFIELLLVLAAIAVVVAVLWWISNTLRW
jgi:prepilin-type N-terminal cleavage/methylation domain-containing protein